MDLSEFSGRLGRIEEKLEAIAKLTACLESIAEKIRYMDQVSKQRIGQIEQDLRLVRHDVDLMKHNCAVQTAKCPVEKVSRFEWLIFGTCITTMGALAVALVVAYMQIRQAFPMAGG